MTIRRYFVVKPKSELMAKCVDAVNKTWDYLERLETIGQEIGDVDVMIHRGRFVGFRPKEGTEIDRTHLKKVRNLWYPKKSTTLGREMIEAIKKDATFTDINSAVGECIGIGHQSPLAVESANSVACSTVTVGVRENLHEMLIIITVPDRDKNRITDEDLENYRQQEHRGDMTMNWYASIDKEMDIPGLYEVKKWEAYKLVEDYNTEGSKR